MLSKDQLYAAIHTDRVSTEYSVCLLGTTLSTVSAGTPTIPPSAGTSPPPGKSSTKPGTVSPSTTTPSGMSMKISFHFIFFRQRSNI